MTEAIILWPSSPICFFFSDPMQTDVLLTLKAQQQIEQWIEQWMKQQMNEQIRLMKKRVNEWINE